MVIKIVPYHIVLLGALPEFHAHFFYYNARGMVLNNVIVVNKYYLQSDYF
jgi:hypothetical protein